MNRKEVEVKLISHILTEEGADLTDLQEKHFKHFRSAYKYLKTKRESKQEIDTYEMMEFTNLTEEEIYKLVDNQPVFFDFKQFKQRIKAITVREELKSLAEILLDEQYTNEEKMEYVQKQMTNINKDENIQIHDLRSELLKVKDRALQSREKLNNNNTDYMMTGFSEIDNIITGFESDDFVIIGALTSMGKSVFAMNVALNNAKQGKKVLYINLEMGVNSTVDRFAGMIANIQGRNIKSGYTTNKELEQLEKALELEQYKNIKLDIINGGKNLTQNNIVQKIRALVNINNYDVVYIDHIGNLVSGDRYKNTTELVRQLRLLNLEINVPIVAISQLSRDSAKVGVTKEGNAKFRRPVAQDLKESGEVENSATKIIMLFREDYQAKGQDADDEASKLEVHIVKNRDGALDMVELGFKKEYTKLFSLQNLTNH